MFTHENAKLETGAKKIDRIEIAKLLRTLKINPDERGHYYLCDAIEIALDRPDYLSIITKAIYPAIASMRKKKPSAIERAIRTAIVNAETFWRENYDIMPQHIKETVDEIFPLGGNIHYTNKEFISIIADYFIARQ